MANLLFSAVSVLCCYNCVSVLVWMSECGLYVYSKIIVCVFLCGRCDFAKSHIPGSTLLSKNRPITLSLPINLTIPIIYPKHQREMMLNNKGAEAPDAGYTPQDNRAVLGPISPLPTTLGNVPIILVDLKIILSYISVVWGVIRVTESSRKNVGGWSRIINIQHVESCCRGGGGEQRICRLSRETKQYPIRKRADRGITNTVMAQHKRIWTLSSRDFFFFFFFFFSNFIYCNLYISPGLMFCFLVIFQDLCILFISKLYLVLLL